MLRGGDIQKKASYLSFNDINDVCGIRIAFLAPIYALYQRLENK